MAQPLRWRAAQQESRQRLLALYDRTGSERYKQWLDALTDEDRSAFRQDLESVLSLLPGMRVLEVGAGAGFLTRILQEVPGLQLELLEPAPGMLELLEGDEVLRGLAITSGFCDGPEDRSLFPADRFDVVISRQVVNGLFDPLVAFANWWHWLKPGGTVVVLDGLFDRSDWREGWAEELDQLPLAANQSLALYPYLLEHVGFQVSCPQWLTETNRLTTTRRPRYAVVARKGSVAAA